MSKPGVSTHALGRMPTAERLSRGSVPVPGPGCVLWVGTWTGKGYGEISVGGKRRLAHRLSFEVANGPIPEGMLVCHKCDTPACINPDHLFVGTYADNNQDTQSKGRGWQQKVTHCPHGHPFSGDNLFFGNDGGRRCRACSRNDTNRRRHERRLLRGTK